MPQSNDTELKRIKDEVSKLMENMFYTYVHSGPFVSDPDELLREWSPPDDDRIIDVLTDLLRNPTDYVRENGSTDYWDCIVSDTFVKAVGTRAPRISMCRHLASDPALRPFITDCLSSIHGEGRELLRDDLMSQVSEMGEVEIDALVEELLMEDYRNGNTDGYRRMIALLRQAPAHYKPYPFHMQGRLGTTKEWEAGRVSEWESLVKHNE